MTKNVGKADKALRVVIAIGFFVTGLVADIGVGLKIIVFILSATALFTALFGT